MPVISKITGAPFRFWCQKILPAVYDDSLSYYELLCKVVDYLNKVMEDDINVVNLVNELEEFVNNYFDNLDVQEEINNKLDVMAEDGSLYAIIAPHLDELIAQYEATLDADLAEYKETIDADITDFKSDVNDTLEAQDTDIADFKEDVNEQIADQNEEIGTFKTTVNTAITEQNNDITVMQSQMSSFISSQTADANTELLDIRVGSIGEIYDTAGDSVRGQIDTLKDLSINLDSAEYDIASSFNNGNNSNASILNSPFIWSHIFDPSSYIYAIKTNVVTAGTLSIGISDIVTTLIAPSTDQYEVKEVITFTRTGVQTVALLNPFKIPEGKRLFIGTKTDTAVFTYGANGTIKGFNYLVPNSETWGYSSNSLNIDIYTLKCGENLITNSISDFLNTYYGNNDILSKDYSNLNNNESSTSVYPIIVNHTSIYDFIATEIHINIVKTGFLSVGTVESQYVVPDVPFDFSKLKMHEVIYFDTVGEQTVKLSSPMFVSKNEMIYVGGMYQPATYKYGGTGESYYYFAQYNTDVVASARNITLSTSKTGFELKGKYLKNDSAYTGKKLSILGDSISTFSGYISSGNATYYPAGTVQNVNDTWWKKLADALGMTIEVNNSWSGSRVTTTGGDTSAGCGTRAESLGTNPDVIIVWMGINDFNNEVQLGTYNGESAIPETTTSFREAYAIMLNKILTAYPSAEVWCCTLPQCERNAESGFPEVNGNGVTLNQYNLAIEEIAHAMNVKVLDHARCGLTYQNMPTFNPDNLHPNKYGHSLIANHDIRIMDSSVTERYPISA